MEEIVYKYWYLSNEDIPYTRKMKLIDYFQDAYHIYCATEKELLDSGLMNIREVETFIRKRDAVDLYNIYEEFKQGPYSFVTIEDKNYPQGLREIFDPPYGLFYIGRLGEFENAVSIVGARRCSEYGKHMALVLGEALSKRGYTVISGMARGIDSYAHLGALKGGSDTVAVLGCGVDIVYPKENRKLYENIINQGAVVSEFPIGHQPVPMNFPIRNRIVAGMSKSIIVVEAKLKSGSLITADQALEQGKDIYVVPGRIGDSLSEGCNKLLAQGANMIYSIEQLISDLGEISSDKLVEVTRPGKMKIDLSEDEVMALSYFDYYPKSVAQIQTECGLDYLKLVSIVFNLVNHGLLIEVFKNHYIVCG